MLAPAVPADEEQRLRVLREMRILDTESEERFDRITRLAQRLFDVPIALVSLIDENRQWFKSCQGLGVSETPRAISFCGHAILGSEVFVIEDPLADERFADNPLVTGEPHIRFYAGAPLAAGGQNLGTLCLIDKKPRRFGEQERAALRDLAVWAQGELETIHRERSLADRVEERLRLAAAIDGLEDAVLVVSAAGWLDAANAAAISMLGVPAQATARQRVWSLFAHEDLDALRRAIAAVRPGEPRPRLQAHARNSQGAAVTLDLVCSPLKIEGRNAVLLVARPALVPQGVSEEQKAADSAIAEAGGVALFDWDYAGGRLHLLAGWPSVLGETVPAPVSPDALGALVHPHDRDRWQAFVYALLKSGQANASLRLQSGDSERPVRVRARVIGRDGVGQVARVAGAIVVE